MIGFVKGDLIEVTDQKAVVAVGGFGMNVLISGRDMEHLQRKTDTEVLLHTYLQVREDAMQLFGFLKKEDKEIFQLLINVNGIGPKAALGILSAFSSDELRFAVLAGDAKTISKAPGIGNKTAQKLILELKDKFDLLEVFEEKLAETEEVVSHDQDVFANEAVQALIALGYPGSEALKAVRSVDLKGQLSTEDILKAALKKMAF